MKISNKLLVIVLLTVVEVSVTLWSVLEVSKGATLHQLNSLHLKYSVAFTRQVFNYENDTSDEVLEGESQILTQMRETIINIKKPPLECLVLVNDIDILIMKMIGTYRAYELCEKDIEDADATFQLLDDYGANKITKKTFIQGVKNSAVVFTQNSADFEQPMTKTVSLIVTVVIPLVIIMSLFNIIFISFLSRSITGSISNVIKVLKSKSTDSFQSVATGELKELLDVALTRAKDFVLQEQVNAALEDTVAQRTTSLVQANDELSQFAYRTSHDLKSPIIAAKALSQIIQHDLANGNTQIAIQDVIKIEKEMIRLESLVKNILSLTEASQQEMKSEVFNLSVLANNICEQLKDRAAAEKVEIRLTIQDNLLVQSSNARLTQILQNLLSNAIKYCDDSKLAKYVSVDISHSKQTLSLLISDNGIGFPKQRQSEVFQMFKRFHPEVSAGTGLGLSIVKKHIESLQGDISLSSGKEGSIVAINIPCALGICKVARDAEGTS
ncbi:MAG: signal transduction histidine kinase [Alphaproteobacteria bacterium]|jgi:signal transduction histidine kinase